MVAHRPVIRPLILVSRLPYSAPSSRSQGLETDALLDAFAEAAALVDPGGLIRQVNRAFTARFGPGPWEGRSLDCLLLDSLDVHAAPWRLEAASSASSGPALMRVRLPEGEELDARITVRRAAEGVFLATLVATPGSEREGESGGGPGMVLAQTRLDLALRYGGLSPWRHDFDIGEGWVEGALGKEYPAPAGFGPGGWRGRIHPDDLSSLTAAFLAMEFGGRLDQRFRVRAPGGLWRLHHASGVREPGFGRGARRASGFLRELGVAGADADTETDTAEAAASAQMSAWTYELHTGRLRLTGAVLERLGLPAPSFELTMADWRARVPEADQSQIDRATRELARDGVTEVEYRVRAEDGQLVWLSLRGGVSEQDASGAVLRYSGFLAEIGPRKLLEQKLADRERQLSEAVEAGLVGIWSIDLLTGAQMVQGRLASWMNAGPDGEISAQVWRTVIHEDDFPNAYAAFKDVAASRELSLTEYRLRTPKGWLWVRTAGRVVERDPAGRAVRAAGVVIDISAERAFARALKTEKRRFETVYQNTPALMHSIDAQGRTIMVSDYWVARMGYTREEVIGAPGWSFFAPADQARVRDDVIPRSMRDGVIRTVPLTQITKSGERIEVRLSAFWERDEAGRPLRAHGVFDEVGDLNQARRETEGRNQELERVNRELNRFTTIASHDLQEPLRKISAFASLLRRRYGGTMDSDADRSLEYLVDAAGRMRTLIDDLLAYTRASSRTIEPEQVDLGALWREVAEAHDLQIAEAEAVMETGDLPSLRADPALMKLLLANLLSNALKYRKGQGVRIAVKGFIQRGEVCLSFADDGIGFDPRFAAKVFEPFARLHGRDEFVGTGIGLAICQQAVERQGGRIWVESAPDEGARFLITLPGAQAAAELDAEGKAESESEAETGVRDSEPGDTQDGAA
jgi:PAS domain S-box-containing protein